jgi:very-short-patch-repair endonuclease
VTSIESALASARQSLLDLTLRNRLLNYRPSTARSIRVVGELPAEIYDALVLREKALEFRAAAKSFSATVETWSARTELEARHTDRFLQTPHDDETLTKKLFRVYHEGRSAVEEQGYTVAHLAVGFLEWFESESSEQPRRAPLLLVPAELERVRAGDFSKVRWTGEDVFANISLAAKLVEHGVAMPPFEPPEEKGGIDAWLQRVVEAVARKPRWRVLSELVLDFFSFTKFVMFKDLDPATWPDGRKPHDHPLLQTLFDSSGDAKEAPLGIEDVDAKQLWHVMDADPSQIAVIEEVKAGRNLVVEGPPGTGKSQTITNLIAETLAAGRTVLFVSEKMAALEVVKSRLDDAGLDPFCLELHSRKSNKKAVLEELQRSLTTTPRAALPDAEEHEPLKRDLNAYAQALREPVGKWGKTPWQLLNVRQASACRGQAEAGPTFVTDAENITGTDVAAAENALRDLAYILPSVHPVAAHPWRASTRAAMVPQDEQELRAALTRTLETVRTLMHEAATLAAETGVQEPASLAALPRAMEAAEVLARAGAPTESALLLSNEWNAANPAAEELVSRAEALQRERAALVRTFREDAIEESVANELDEFGRLAAKFFRIFSGRYRALRRRLAALYGGPAPEPRQMIADISRLAEHQSARDALRGDPRGRGFFGARWLADRSDCAALRQFSEWIVVFRRELLANALTRRAVEIASTRADAEAVRARIEALRIAAEQCRAGLRAIFEEVCIDASVILSRVDGEGSPAETQSSCIRGGYFAVDAAQDDSGGGGVDGVPFAKLVAQVEEWQQQPSMLFRWTQFHAAREKVRATAAAPLVPYVNDDSLDAAQLIPFFRTALAESLLRIAFAQRPALGRFIGELHEQKIARFREIDAGLVAIQRAKLSRELHRRRPQLSGGASPNSEAGILLHQMHRMRGHMPIRKLLTRAGGLIQRIKPCFLMSPLSIAQFLDPRTVRFDLIVFDEASQVRPEDAVGALLRGAQLVVMGDTQQLPPTSFFDHLAAGDDTQEEEEQSASMKDVESILHQCARSFPSKTLQWHYRSRHESLIAISNLHFYKNQLRIYPSAIDWADDLGLHFVPVPHGVYDRGRTGTNRIEAQTVAAAALEHFRRHPGKSLGIGTFNIQQQQAIQEELELLLRAHPELEAAIGRVREPLFVKNLETIQGDERDTILISLGFGRDSAGRLSLNFGPINREGGERRLNVLISRAREKCVVFSNFTAQELMLDGTNAKGMFALKAFLEYAQTRRLTIAEAADDEHSTAFEDAIAEVLASHGYTVRRRVGCAGFRVDLAVVDPNEPGRYLLAVECDGPKYYDATVARDRDRLRQQMLERLGWTVHRVWSTDWYRDPEATIARLLDDAGRASARPDELKPVLRLEPPEPLPEPEVVEVKAEEIPSYEICRDLRIPVIGELHLVAPEMLAAAVEDVVRVEGPVHVDEVVRRIRTLWGLQRAGVEFATPRTELIDAAARRVGIQATSTAVAARLGTVIDAEVRRGRLTLDGEVVRPTRA